MTLSDLCGEHLLSGVDFTTRLIKRWGDDPGEEANVCRFRLDGKTYEAVEDPGDGYRSSMRELVVSDDPLTNTWEPVRVVGTYVTQSRYSGEADILALIDVKTGGTVLRVGTDNTNDYYPSFISEFTPEALAHNAPGRP